MNLLRPLLFELWYYCRPPWESGSVPPEVDEFIAAHPSTGSGQARRRALDLGCGTGTSSLALARAGWQVTGVDFAPRAIRLARRKAKAANLEVDFRVGDVTQLIGPSSAPSKEQAAPLRAFDLVLDIGCFHGLGTHDKAAYLHNLDHLLAPDGTWLMYGFFKPDAHPGPGLLPVDLELIKYHVTLTERKDSWDKKNRPSTWFWFQKP